MMIIEEPVMMRDPIGVLEFIDTIMAVDEHPRFIVLDTLARCACGLNENDQRDMGLFVNSCDVIRKKTGACVCFLHHPGKSNGAERGSTVLRAACDTVLSLQADGTALTLKVEKQKDGAPSDPIYMTLQPVQYGDVKSCIIGSGESSESGELPKAVWQCHQALADCSDENGATTSTWLKVSELTDSTS
jgi:hypothetical protein